MKRPTRMPARSRIKNAKLRTQHCQQKTQSEARVSAAVKKAMQSDFDA